jgi:sugar phosphate isomerase/epimerase
MELGIFAKTFPRTTLEETLDAVVAHGLKHVQFNLSCVNLQTLPERLDPDQCAGIARALRDRGLTMSAISGTFNPLAGHKFLQIPHIGKAREDFEKDFDRYEDAVGSLPDFDRLELLASCCQWLDTRIITLSTGTRDAHHVWRWHGQNVSRQTWNALVERLNRIVEIGDRYQVVMAFEPELSNVVNSVCKARRLLDEIHSPWLKVVLDLSNLIRPDDIPRMGGVIDEAFDWLGDDVALVHVKELSADGHPGDLAPGQGILDYGFILNELERIGYNGTLIMHGLSEDQVEPGVKFMRKMMGFSRGTS